MLAADAIVHLAGKAHDTKNAARGESLFRCQLQSDSQGFRLFSQS